MQKNIFCIFNILQVLQISLLVNIVDMKHNTDSMLVYATEGSVNKAQVHPTGSCNMSLGPCSFECYAKCCATKCQERVGGVGICVSIGRGVSLCQCTYPCIWTYNIMSRM